MTTDTPSTFDSGDMRKVVGYDMTRAAATQVYEAAGIGPEELDVVELHDCFTANELISYEALRLTPEGTAEKFIVDGDNTYGGRVVTNPSGGLLSKGHPLGATGLAQCAELVWQLRGQAEQRQVEGARLALQHNLGLGGACVVTLYETSPMIDRRHIGHVLPAFTVPVEAGRLRFFAKATGNTDPVYIDEAAARDAGHPNLPVPPTFFFCLEMEQPNPAAMRELLGHRLPQPAAWRAALPLPRDGLCRRQAALRAAHRGHLRQEGRRARVRGARDARDQPARRAGRRADAA